MAISKKKMKNIFEESFLNEKSFQISAPSERSNFLKEFAEKIKSELSEFDIHFTFTKNKDDINQITQAVIHNNSCTDWNYKTYYIGFDKDNFLKFSDYRMVGYLSGTTEELRLFFNKFKELEKEIKFAEEKTTKLKNLKTKAVEASINEIAKEDGFEYAVVQSPIRVNLYIKLEIKDILVIHIPYKSFQESLTKVRMTIKIINELQKEGISFKIEGKKRLHWKKGI